jgi:hypothetical protein
MAKRTVWQIAAGTADRSYCDQFIRHSIALLGPGDIGDWNSDRDDSLYEGHHVRHFASEVAEGDIFLLRAGNSRVTGIGVVASGYLYLPQFDDVNGWDLQHCRRVRWFPLPEEHNFNRPVFGANSARFSRVWDEEAVRFAERFVNSPPTDWQTKALPALPAEEPLLHSIPPYLAEVVHLAQDLGANLYWDRQKFGDPPSEHEIVSHLVVPFLCALGWRQEQIAVEWRRIDVALFRTLPRVPENCHLVVEAKTLGAGVEGALEQGKGYAGVCGNVADVLVTDGVRYRLYSCAKGYQEIGYANLTRLKARALELFERLKTVGGVLWNRGTK